MAEYLITCAHFNECSSKSVTRCKRCKNNKTRNVEIDFFEAANDNPIPEKDPYVTFDGPAEQTAGYQCPVCGGFTNPYTMRDSRCVECGFKLNITNRY